MKTFNIAIALLISSLGNSAMASETYTLSCQVITNGNGTNWENVIQIPPVSLATRGMMDEARIQQDITSKYGDSFSLDVLATAFNGTVSLSQKVELTGKGVMLGGFEVNGDGKTDTNMNLVTQSQVLTFKQTTKKWVSYNVVCSVK